MYNINELEAMPLEEVQAYAKSLGIKKVDSETLVYDILDQQATIASANTGASKASEPKKRKSATVATKKADAAKPKQEKKVEELKRKKRRLRNELEDREDEISEQRRKMIAELEQKMIQSTESQNLFFIRWTTK